MVYLSCVHVLYLSLVVGSSGCSISSSHLLVCFFSNSESGYFLKASHSIQNKVWEEIDLKNFKMAAMVATEWNNFCNYEAPRCHDASYQVPVQSSI